MLEAFLAWQKDDLQPQANALATNVYNNAVEAATSATTATTQAGTATTQATAAAASAASAINAPGTNANSTTSLSLTAGAKAWTIQTGKLYPPGVPFFLASAANPTVNRMYGILGTHDNTTGACTATMTPDPGASGTHTDWIMGIGVSLAGTASLPRVARTNNTALTVAEKGKLIDITSGTFAQTTDAAGTLGADWFAYLTNTGTGVPTYSTTSLPQGALILLHSDGTTVRSYVLRMPEQVLIVRDEKTSGTSGGNATAATWNARDLNTTKVNTIVGASVGGNLIAVPAGTYIFRAWTTGYGGGGSATQHQCRLYNVTASAALTVGGSARAAANAASTTELSDQLTFASATSIRLEHYFPGAVTDGKGLGLGVGVEVYSCVEIRKVG